jgi:hypothetical protein
MRKNGWLPVASDQSCWLPLHDAACPEMTFPTCTDPTRNIDRFYVVQVMPTLFGDWAVMREWGRRGSPGTMRLTSYQRRN